MFERRFKAFEDIRITALRKKCTWHAEHARFFIGNIRSVWERSAVLRVVPANYVEYDPGISDCFGQWTDLVERRSERHQSETGNGAIGGLHSHYAGKRGGLPYRAAGVTP